jgi:hypothetical protein
MRLDKGTWEKIPTVKRLADGLALLLFLAAFSFFLLKAIFPLMGQMTHGFTAYYTASVLLARRELGPQAYDITWFSRQVQTVIPQATGEVMTYNLPTFALLTLPLLVFDPQTARDLSMWLNVLLLLASLGLMIAIFPVRQKSLRASFWFVFAAFVFLFPPTLANFYLGQAYIVLLFLFTLTLWGLLNGRDWLVGLTLGLAFILKSSGLPLWLLLLTPEGIFDLQRRWRALGWGLATILAVALFSLPWVGLDIWRVYPQATWGATHSPLVTVTAYQTTHSFLSHLFRYDATWNPQPLSHQPLLADLLNLLITTLAVTLTLWRGRQASTATLFAALMCLNVILSPVAEEHNSVLLLLPLVIVFDRLLATNTWLSLDGVLLGLGCLLLLAPLPYKQPAWGLGWLALLAYPRLYGGWLIWLVTVRQMGMGEATSGGCERRYTPADRRPSTADR